MSRIVAITSTLLLMGCAAGQSSPAASTPGQVTPPAATSTSASTSAAAEPAAAKPAMIEVPDGIGLDYQSAQDAWRAAGLHVAPAVDATGANRLPVIDSNWMVLSQDPKAGSKAQAGSFVTATVKKFSD